MNPLPRNLSLAILAICCVVTSCNNGCEYRVLAGTNTEGTDAQGVYLYRFNGRDASFELLDTARAENPSFLAVSADGTLAWSVEELSDGRQGAASYRLEKDSIERMNSCRGAGASPCNILAIGGNVYTSDYSGGTVTAFTLLDDGTVGPAAAQFKPDGEEPSHHFHCAMPSPDGKYVFATDLGQDKVFRFRPGDALEPFREMQEAVSFIDHKGPRHLIFSADGRYAYMINELSDDLCTFSYEDGELTLVSCFQAYEGSGHGSADIHLSPDGRFLYTSHRLKEDGIAVFRIGRDGVPVPSGYFPTGIHPRNFAITPNGRFLLCACRDSDRIEVYRLSRTSGALKPTGRAISIPSPLFVRVLDFGY